MVKQMLLSQNGLQIKFVTAYRLPDKKIAWALPIHTTWLKQAQAGNSMRHLRNIGRGVTDQQTDQRTDRPSYRDAMTHLKICSIYTDVAIPKNKFFVLFNYWRFDTKEKFWVLVEVVVLQDLPQVTSPVEKIFITSWNDHINGLIFQFCKHLWPGYQLFLSQMQMVLNSPPQINTNSFGKSVFQWNKFVFDIHNDDARFHLFSRCRFLLVNCDMLFLDTQLLHHTIVAQHCSSSLYRNTRKWKTIEIL